MKVKNMYSADLFEKNYETNHEPSLTIPDQTLSIKQILTRFASGLPIGGHKNPLYDEFESEEYIPDPRYMDLADRQQYAEIYKNEIQTIKESTKTTQTDVNSEAQ